MTDIKLSDDQRTGRSRLSYVEAGDGAMSGWCIEEEVVTAAGVVWRPVVDDVPSASVTTTQG